MKITSITAQKRNSNRVNVSVDGNYKFSLDVYQIIDLGIKIGDEYSKEELDTLECESQFGKIYSRAVEYCLIRPRSIREVSDYLYKKSVNTRNKEKNSFPIEESMTKRVICRLEDKGYIDDQKFSRYWVENRLIKKGISRRKLVSELKTKGIDNTTIEQVLSESNRNDDEEIRKIIIKKYSKYDDKKLVTYLFNQGFNYSDIQNAIDEFKKQ